MMIKSIIITCPDCKKKFVSTKMLSFNTFNGAPDFNDEDLALVKKCPGCGNMVDIADSNNWIYTPESPRKWFYKFLP